MGVHILYGFYCKKKLEEKILKICINVFNEICMCIYLFIKEGCLLVLVVEISKTTKGYHEKGAHQVSFIMFQLVVEKSLNIFNKKKLKSKIKN